MKQLTERQKKILKIIIKEYIDSVVPVGSKELVEKYNLPFSSATVRNEMAILEKMGFLQKTHISSGRIPTDKGYRYFIDYLAERREVSVRYQKKLELELLKMRVRNVQLERSVGKILSTLSKCLVISGVVDRGEYQNFGIHNLLESPELNNLDDFSKITVVLDNIDEKINKILAKAEKGEVKIFIGKENPIREIRGTSMIVSRYEDKDGHDRVIALIGPKSMKYQKNKKLIEFAKKLLGFKREE